jgi:heat shock protein HslJ
MEHFMHRKTHWSIGLFVLLLVALAGCSSGGGEVEDTGEQGTTVVEAGSDHAPDGMTDIVWQWLSVDSTGAGGEQVTVANPADYTVIFRAGGGMSGQADCNNFEGTYTTGDGGAMTIAIAHSTDESCGEDSLDREFLDLLSGVAAGGPDGAGGFAMTTIGGADYMLFSNGGPAAAP